MILKNAEIAQIATNCLGVKTKDNGRAEFVRMTDYQIELYKQDKFFPNPHCTPCVCLDFIFDGDQVSFDFFPIHRSSRNFLSFDLYEDDRMVYSLFTYADAEGQRQFFYQFPDKKKRRVRIFFPYSVGVEVYNFSLLGHTFYEPTPSEGRMKLLILGDSITHGYDTHYTSMNYAATMVRHYDAICLNQAVGGYFFKAEMIDENLPFEPDVITVAYGTNDWGRYGMDEEKYREAAKTYIDKLCATYPNAKIFGILPLWRADIDRRPERMPFAKVYDILTEYYSAHENVTIIDGRNAVPNLRFFYTDGLHPNTVGQAAYAQYVIDAMEKAGIRK